MKPSEEQQKMKLLPNKAMGFNSFSLSQDVFQANQVAPKSPSDVECVESVVLAVEGWQD